MANLRVGLLLLAMLAFSSPAFTRGVNSFERLLRQQNAGLDSYYKSRSGGLVSSASTSKGCVKPGRNAIAHGRINCPASTGCRVRCLKGYQMEGMRSATLICDTATGQLNFHGQHWRGTLPPCLPSCGADGCPAGQTCVAPRTCVQEEIQCPPGFTGPNCENFECDPPCENGGTCILPGICECSSGYFGLLCDKHNCAVPDQNLAHGTFGADTALTTLKVECDPGYKLTSGETSVSFICKNQQWIIPSKGTPIDEVDVDCEF